MIPSLIVENPLFQWGRTQGRKEGGAAVLAAVMLIELLVALYFGLLL